MALVYGGLPTMVALADGTSVQWSTECSVIMHFNCSVSNVNVNVSNFVVSRSENLLLL